MLRIIRIRRAGRPPKGPRTLKQTLSLMMGIFLLLFLGVSLLLFFQLIPLVTRVALIMAKNTVTQAINEAVISEVSDGVVVYGNLVQFEKDDNGQITAMTNNMAELSRLRAKLANQLISVLSSLTIKEFGIPVGNLTGSPLFSGRGPTIPFRILSVGAVQTEFENSFTSAGINQTLHTILFKVSVNVQVLIPGNTATTTVESKVNIAETVIVGTVPDNYTYFSQFETAKEAADSYFDWAPNPDSTGNDATSNQSGGSGSGSGQPSGSAGSSISGSKGTKDSGGSTP